MFARKIAVGLAAPVLAAATWAAMSVAPAGATTGTCLGTQNPVSGPVSCGGLFLPGMDPATAGQPNSGTLSLTAASDYWNAPLTFSLYSPSASTQDFTVYEVCQAVDPNPADRTETNPCGTASPADIPVLNPASGRPEFVAEITPDGTHVGAAINNIGNLCISWEAQRIGPRHAYRELMVERTCDTNGAVFYAGITDGTATGPAPARTGTGVPGVVTNPNPFQTFAAIPGNGGDVIANDALSHNFRDTLYVVDDKGLGYPGPSPAILYPENDQKNEIASFLGCNGAVITTGVTYDCP